MYIYIYVYKYILLYYDEFSDAQANDLRLEREIMTPIDSLVDIVRASEASWPAGRPVAREMFKNTGQK